MPKKCIGLRADENYSYLTVLYLFAGLVEHQRHMAALGAEKPVEVGALNLLFVGLCV